MRTIQVPTGKPYEVLIENGLLPNIGESALKVHAACTAVIVSDSNVFPLYGKTVSDSLSTAGFSVLTYIFPAGESSKCGATYLDLLNYLAENKVTRTDVIVALGGGVVGDLSGFAAATYSRGISYIQIPTTLLAAVDSSVGGKTAIDLPAGKNLAGAFHQPIAVLCDPDTLNTLPEDIFLAGCAEVIKYGILYDTVLFETLLSCGTAFDREAVIARCVELKRDVVAVDEFDTGARQFLNLGHTIGHGVEAHSNFTLSHGFSVAIGMAIVARASAEYGYCTPETRDQILDILQKFHLPIHTETSPDDLYNAALSDKKRSGKNINLIVPAAIGNCFIQKTPVNEVLGFIKAGI